MINKWIAGSLMVALVVSPMSVSAAPDTLRAVGVQNPETRAGLEESLLGQEIGQTIRRAGLRWGRYLALAGLMFQVAKGPSWPAPQALGAAPAATQPPTSLPKAPPPTETQLTVTFPSSLAGQWVGAYLFIAGDIGYLQGVQLIPQTGAVTFTVPVSPPSRPGWVAAGDRVLAVFPPGVATGPSTAAKPNAIGGASLVVSIALNGTITVISGQWPVETPPTAPPGAPPATPPAVSVLGPLRAFLGPDRMISLYANDPTTLATDPTLADFFPLAAQRGVDVVWISGFRFSQMTDAQRRTLAEAAAKTGRTIGIVDGNYDWDLPQTQPWVENFEHDLLSKLPLIRVTPTDPAVQGAAWKDMLDKAAAAAKDLPVTYMFQVDFEPYIKVLRPDWTGDLSPYLSRLVEGTILPLLRDFRDAHPEHLRPGAHLLYRFEPSWLDNGVRTDDGAVISGLIEDPETIRDTAIMGGTYGNTVAGIQQRSQTVLARTRATGMAFQIGVETIAGVGTPAYAGNPEQAPADLLQVFQALSPGDFARCDGAFLHARDPKEAYRILTAFGQAPVTPPAPLAVSPDGRWTVRRDTAGGVDTLEFWAGTTRVDRFTLPAALAGGTLYPQFPNNEYLLVLAQGPGGALASHTFYVFGIRRGVSAVTWPLATLRDPQGADWSFFDSDPQVLFPKQPVFIHRALPLPETPNGESNPRLDKVWITYSPIQRNGQLGPPRTAVYTIRAPAGLEEAQDDFLREQQGIRRDTGRLA